MRRALHRHHHHVVRRADPVREPPARRVVGERHGVHGVEPPEVPGLRARQPVSIESEIDSPVRIEAAAERRVAVDEVQGPRGRRRRPSAPSCSPSASRQRWRPRRTSWWTRGSRSFPAGLAARRRRIRGVGAHVDAALPAAPEGVAHVSVSGRCRGSAAPRVSPSWTGPRPSWLVPQQIRSPLRSVSVREANSTSSGHGAPCRRCCSRGAAGRRSRTGPQVVGIGDLVGGGDARADRAERVERLAQPGAAPQVSGLRRGRDVDHARCSRTPRRASRSRDVCAPGL